MAETEFIQYAGQVIIDSVTLYSADRKSKLDLSFLFNEINIFEDIYATNMHGSMTIVEGFNLPTFFPILGEEMLEFVCHTPTMDRQFKKTFAVVGVSDKFVKNNKTQIYVLNFVTIESLVDMNLRVYRVYSGTPSDSAAQIFKTYFPAAKLRVEKSNNTLKIVSPSVSPFNLMNLFASKAYSSSNEPNYLFYEDNQSYNFMSLSGLYSQTPRMTYRWSQSQMRIRDEGGESTRDVQAEYENVKDLTIDSLHNLIEKRMSSSMGHKVFEIDVVRKTINKRTYAYMDDFKSTSHLNPYPVHSSNLVSTPNAVMETSIIHPAHHNNFPQDSDGDILTRRPAMLALDQFIKLDIVVHGRTDVKVGDIINFEMGTFSTNEEKDQMLEDRIDPYYSGRYMIAAIQHRFTLNRHEAIMQIVKDSFNSAINFNRM